MPRSLREIAAHTGSRLLGNDITVSGVASIASAQPGDVVEVRITAAKFNTLYGQIRDRTKSAISVSQDCVQ